LSNNNITKIEHLNNATKLEYINLGVNNITEIENLDGLNRLKTLRLHNNAIHEVKGLDWLNLELVDLRYNSIEWVEGFGNLKKIQRIALNGNPLRSLQERRLIDLGFEYGNVGIRMREKEIAKDLVEYSKGKQRDTLIDSITEDLRRILVKGINTTVGV
jgi:Leucine-rich repeat (LRR) protein